MTRSGILAIGLLPLLIADCGAHYAREARQWAPGKPLAELEACAGIPDRTDRLTDGSTIIQWNAADATTPVATVPLSVITSVPGVALPASALAGTLPLASGGGSCRAIAVVRDGNVTGLRYAGPGDGLSGRDATCGRDIMRGCMRE